MTGKLWSDRALDSQREINRTVEQLANDSGPEDLKHQLMPTLVRAEQDVDAGLSGLFTFMEGPLEAPQAGNRTAIMWNSASEALIKQGDICLAQRVHLPASGEGGWVVMRGSCCGTTEDTNDGNTATVECVGACDGDEAPASFNVTVTDVSIGTNPLLSPAFFAESDRQELADDINDTHTLPSVRACYYSLDTTFVTTTSWTHRYKMILRLAPDGIYFSIGNFYAYKLLSQGVHHGDYGSFRKLMEAPYPCIADHELEYIDPNSPIEVPAEGVDISSARVRISPT